MQERFIGLAMTRKFAYYRDILRGIVGFAENQPHWRFVTLGENVDRTTRETLKHVDGVIAGIHTREWCRVLQRTRVPFVNIDCRVPGLPVPRVGVDNRLIGQIAARHFEERGLRSFAFIGHKHSLYSIEREAAFREAVTAANHRLAVYHTQNEHVFDDTGTAGLMNNRGVQRWLLSLSLPTGVLTPNDLWGMELAEVCRKVGLRVPEDIAVLGVDDDDLYCAMSRPPLSSIIVPSQAIGLRAAMLLKGLMDRRKPCLKRDVLLPPGSIVVRRSTDLVAIDDPDVIAAIRFIRENSHRPLRVADVLREVPVSRRWLERRVTAAIGVTLGTEIRRAHLDRARKLLAETSLSITQVAEGSGFSDLRHLEVTFHREFGRTPTQFRRETCGR